MKNKKDRITVIRDIVQSQSISSQDELLKELQLRGFKVTQATLSRDLKQMQIAKYATREGSYMYVMPDLAASFKNNNGSPHFIPSKTVAGVVSIECSQVLIVVRTKPGYASSIAYDIDMSALPEVMGTLAGDDTILVIPRGGYSTHQVAEALCAALPKSF
ncbi:MAG: arginine repressor [Bacteroidales bacterium]|nr:arginine repressor [Bacteroidales bacterium]